jgi:hypothetical protein
MSAAWNAFVRGLLDPEVAYRVGSSWPLILVACLGLGLVLLLLRKMV